jgi:hypothetical protein
MVEMTDEFNDALEVKILRAMAEVFADHDDDTLFDCDWPRTDLMSQACGEPVSLKQMAHAFPDWTRIRSAPIPPIEWDAKPEEIEPQPQPQTGSGLWANDPAKNLRRAEAELSEARVAQILATQTAQTATAELQAALLRWHTGVNKPLTPLQLSRDFARTSQLERAALAAQGQPQRPDPTRSKSARPNARGAWPAALKGVVLKDPTQRYR